MSSELMVIQQNMSFVNEGYASLGETLKSRAADLSSSVQEVKEAQKETDDMMTWLKDMKKTAASWNKAATEKDSVKTQLEQQKVLKCCCRSPNRLFQNDSMLWICTQSLLILLSWECELHITGLCNFILFFIPSGVRGWHEAKAGAAPEAQREAPQLD